MKKKLRIIAIILPLLGVMLWVSHGANKGWTKTQAERSQIDEITGIEYTEYVDKLSFGIELPIATIVGGILVFCGSFMVGRTRS